LIPFQYVFHSSFDVSLSLMRASRALREPL
jgi:hypothetical protein